VFSDIQSDIHIYNIPKRSTSDTAIPRSIPPIDFTGVKDRAWSSDELNVHRQEILKEHPLADEILSFSGKNENRISLDKVLWKHKAIKSGIPLFQPRTGVADINEQINILQYLEKAGSDISSI